YQTAPALPAEAVGPGRPCVQAPLVVGELAVADGGGGQGRVGVDPEETAAGPEVAEGRGRAAVAHPVGALAVVELEAKAPVAGVEAADAGDEAGQARELDADGLGEQLGPDHRGAPVEQAAGQAGQVVEGRGGAGGRVAIDAAAVDEPGFGHLQRGEHAGGQPAGEGGAGGGPGGGAGRGGRRRSRRRGPAGGGGSPPRRHRRRGPGGPAGRGRSVPTPPRPGRPGRSSAWGATPPRTGRRRSPLPGRPPPPRPGRPGRSSAGCPTPPRTGRRRSPRPGRPPPPRTARPPPPRPARPASPAQVSSTIARLP